MVTVHLRNGRVVQVAEAVRGVIAHQEGRRPDPDAVLKCLDRTGQVVACFRAADVTAYRER